MEESAKFGDTVVRVLIGDLTAMEVDSFVFYATDTLELGSGFGNAIAMRGGLSIRKELEKLGRLEPTEAVISGAGMLPAEYIIHANGPKFREPNMLEKLSLTLVNVLKAAEEKGITRIAFPPMGYGFYGIPLADCARTMISTFREYCTRGSSLTEILIVLIDRREYESFAVELAAVRKGEPADA